MLKMRLQRVGRKHDPSFRVIVTEKTRGPKAGRYVDLLGSYDVKHGGVKIDGEKAKLWMAKGAQVSGTVWNLLVSEGIVEGKKVNVLPKKTVQKKEGEEKEAASVETENAASEADEKTSEEGESEPSPEEAPSAQADAVKEQEAETGDTEKSEESSQEAKEEETSTETDEEKK